MDNTIKYVHTNIIAKDWKKLAQFYIVVFGCEPLYPERDLSGEWMDKLTKISGVRVKGIHLNLPGYDNGPTLEIFSYEPASDMDAPKIINGFGFGHIAFHVEDVEGTLNKILANGGNFYGESIEKAIPGVCILKAVYAVDPEENIVEIQHWSKE